MKQRNDSISFILNQNHDQDWEYWHDFKNMRGQDGDEKKAMLHAILFFQYAKDVVPGINFNDIIIKSQNGDKTNKDIQ